MNNFLIYFFQLAVFIGPILACLYSIFGFCTRYADITPLFRWMYHISYFRAGFHGALNSAYGMNRTDLACPEGQVYCHFRNPKIFLREMDIENVNMNDNLILMATVIGIMHVLTVFTLWYKLNKR
jgi:ATP-binding cassette, subfamily G (WHITE), member 1